MACLRLAYEILPLGLLYIPDMKTSIITPYFSDEKNMAAARALPKSVLREGCEYIQSYRYEDDSFLYSAQEGAWEEAVRHHIEQFRGEDGKWSDVRPITPSSLSSEIFFGVEHTMRVMVGDITKLDVVAVVNAANTELRGGAGVDGAIHEAAGREALQSECRSIGHCDVGDAVTTSGYALPARYIIHTVAPYWRGGSHGELEQLESCYRAIMREVIAKRMQSIAIPCIGTGAHKFPSDQAARIAVRTCYRVLREQDMNPPAWPELEMRRVRIIFCCFSDVDAWCYKNLVQELEREEYAPPSLSTVVKEALTDLEVLR